MNVWPASLPQYVNRDGYQSGTGDGRVRSDTDAGIAKLRRRFSAVPRPLSVVMTMTRAQLATFRGFVEDDLKGGTLPFIFASRERTNILSDSSWNNADQTYATWELAQAPGPDGTNTLALITSIAQDGAVAKTAAVPAGDGLIRCASADVCKGNADKSNLVIGYWGGSDGNYVSATTTLDFTTGQFVTASLGAGGIINLGGGLYRIWAALANNDTDGDTVVQIVNGPVGPAGNTLYSGDLQIEVVPTLTAGPTDYIPTSTGPVTVRTGPDGNDTWICQFGQNMPSWAPRGLEWDVTMDLVVLP